MKGIQFELKGNWAHFRKVETNLNPLSHDFITKPAMIGMIGAVLGINRESMRPLFKQLSEDLKYCVQVKNSVKKQSWGFTYRSVDNAFDKAPKQMEIIKDPQYLVSLGLSDEKSVDYFNAFSIAIKNEEAMYEPVLGVHNCPAELKFMRSGFFEEKAHSIFETKGFVSANHIPKYSGNNIFRIGFDKIPTYQNEDFWNLPERFIQVIYPSDGNSILVEGSYHEFSDKTKWVMV